MRTLEQKKATQARCGKAWAKENPEKIKAIKARWYAKNKEAIHAKRREERAKNRVRLDAAKRAWEAANPEKVSMQRARRRIKLMNAEHNRTLRYHYAITLDNYNEALLVQRGVCAICGEHRTTARIRRLVVDHDHATGKLRGLLCHRCNCGLGYFGDKLSLLRKAIAYLENFEGVDGEWPDRVRKVLEALPA